MLNMQDYSAKAQEVLNTIPVILARYKQTQMTSEHILLLITEHGSNAGFEIIEKLAPDVAAVKRDTERAVRELGMQSAPMAPTGQIFITPDAYRILDEAKKEAARMQDNKIGCEHLILGILRVESSGAAKILARHGLSVEKVYTTIKEQRSSGGTAEKDNLGALQKFTIDLCEMAVKGELMPVIGRDDEIRRVIQILGRKTKNNPVVVGDPGVGKTAIAEGLAQRIVEGNIPEYLKGKRLLSLDMGRMIAGTKFRGEFEERMKAVIDAVKKQQGEILLFVDELHTVVGAGATEGSMDAANLMKPALARGELRCMGATTLEDYRKYVEKDKALERRFQMVMIEEPSVEDAIEIVNGIRPVFEKHHQVKITQKAVEAAVKMSKQYISERFLPDKAIDLIDEAASRVKIENTYFPGDLLNLEKEKQLKEKEVEESATLENYEQAARLKAELEETRNRYQARYDEWKKTQETKPKVVNEFVIAQLVEKWTGIPTTRMLHSEREKALNLEAMIHQKYVNQVDAVNALAQSIRRSKAGLKDPKRPTGSFLFLGPSGVGKTELAKVLAEILCGSSEALVRIDMSEYSEKIAVSRLIGASPGYVGYEEGGQLTEAVRRRPFSVVLMDEIEKAHPEVIHILLQLLEDGQLTDGQGHTVDFKNTVIILTSNIGTEQLSKRQHRVGFAADSEELEKDKLVMDELKKYFKPELINRLDNIIIFRNLKPEDVQKIVDLMLERLNERLVDKHIKVDMTERAKDFLAKKGFDESFGARPLRRVFEKHVEVPLSDMLLEGTIEENNDISVDLDEEAERLLFQIHQPDTRRV
ncbi:MAG TPA: ATP-dependent Clp protease ATP-binding subunit [Thermotogota bacterium]|jgi:ATP-dependent Clp protease ATP-binding subunit ClpC|nr:ATP-dependent Clp protease ATP-binding subunit [Thermotogota bacterium]OQC30155.1 MAG: ATP-dependent Clp protease ATP-binding subunit ClpC [Thermotogota bacterium ADurb.Bin062]HNW47492.1 ATP-dependent Clp protease ATP-binding subunit [Thermotogota bacterium]HOD91980.1 ATP-dependent Clp protease ATP-binding subunit [Thermotogota bacterium]HOF24432.1 ATP-dependent Clp protease ATP-binding subunit [Thermotogota bacterium]